MLVWRALALDPKDVVLRAVKIEALTLDPKDFKIEALALDPKDVGLRAASLYKQLPHEYSLEVYATRRRGTALFLLRILETFIERLDEYQIGRWSLEVLVWKTTAAACDTIHMRNLLCWLRLGWLKIGSIILK